MNDERREISSERNPVNQVYQPAGRKSFFKSAVKAVVSTALALCLMASLGLNVYQSRQAESQNKKVNKFIDGQLERQAKEEQQENTYQEDGYVVGSSYEIRSTKKISDAYLSGDKSGLEQEEKETLKMASKILKKIIKDGMNSYEKELAVYEWMHKNIKQGSGATVQLPGTGINAFTPYAVLSTRKNVVCVGYATTFRLFMNMLGMDCHIVHNEYHSWDMVQLDDNEWYQVDVYTDVGANSKYQNFNMSDAVSRNSHEWDGSALPEAKGVKYSYAVQNYREIKDIYAVPAKIKKALDKKKSFAFYKFKKQLSTEELPVADVLVNQMNMALMSMQGFETYNISGTWFLDEDDAYILGIYIANYASQENNVNENSPEGQKMTKAVSEAFGVDLLQPDESTEIIVRDIEQG